MKFTDVEINIAKDLIQENETNNGSINYCKSEIKDLQLRIAYFKSILYKNPIDKESLLKLNREKLSQFLTKYGFKVSDKMISSFLKLGPILKPDEFNKSDWYFKSSIEYWASSINIKFLIDKVTSKQIFGEKFCKYSYFNSFYELYSEINCVKINNGNINYINDFSKCLEKSGFSDKEIKKFEGKIFKIIHKEFKINKSCKIPKRYKKYLLLLG